MLYSVLQEHPMGCSGVGLPHTIRDLHTGHPNRMRYRHCPILPPCFGTCPKWSQNLSNIVPYAAHPSTRNIDLVFVLRVRPRFGADLLGLCGARSFSGIETASDGDRRRKGHGLGEDGTRGDGSSRRPSRTRGIVCPSRKRDGRDRPTRFV